ncbi:MAG: hypothetical protein KAI24_21615 [Planctomycetes bacterium]|nr:hypothetical protein [Planctomycetota bacterium]
MLSRSLAAGLAFAAAIAATLTSQDPATTPPATLAPAPISSHTFAAGSIEGGGWTFEPIGWARDVGRKRVLRVGPEGDAELIVDAAAEGVVLRGKSATARGDLVSPPFALTPLQWIEVELEYETVEGEPVLFVGLRPAADRRQVDLEFAPLGKRKGRIARADLRLHSGLSDGPYALAVSIAGEGAVRVHALRARVAEAYRPPTRPICVIDIRTTEKGARDNPNFARVASVFGFPSVEYIHYTEYERAKLEEINPALIVLPGLVSLKGADKRRIDDAVRDAVQFDAPVIGVCLGHQVLARVHGASLRACEPEWGPTQLEVVRKDPVFAGLPRGRRFFASQSHRFEVREPMDGMRLLASSPSCRTQVLRYRGKPWYTFQGHIERGWEVASPEACLLWKNLLRRWNLVPR